MAQRLIMLAASCLVGTAAFAQPLTDPMRPPAAEARTTPAPAAPNRLQSVLVSAGRTVAVIDGREVRLGERVGDATIVAIDPDEVTLQRGAAREKLTLFPAGVEKRRVKP